MKLIASTGSPFARKVRVAFAELGMADRYELVPPNGSTGPLNLEASGANPVGKIPALVTDDGQAVFDSRMISRYLNELARGDLYPAGDWAMVRRESTAEGMIDATLLLRYETFARPEEKRWDDWVAGQSRKIDQCLAALNADVADLGRVDAASIAAGCALGYLDFRFPDWGWRNGHDGLAKWYEEFRKRPSMESTQPG